MEARPDRRVQRTRAALRRAFFELLARKDPSTITVTELTAEAGVDRSTFYSHFSSVDQLRTDFEDALAQEVGSLLRESTDASGAVDWPRFLVGLDELMERDLSFYRAITSRPGTAYLVDECTAILTHELLIAGAPSGEGRITPAARVRAEFLASGVIGAYVAWLRANGSLRLDEVVGVIAECSRAVESMALRRAWRPTTRRP